MTEQLQLDFDKIVKTSIISKKGIELKRNYLKKFLEKGFPNRKQENWKFLDISQIIKKNIGNLSFFNDYSLPNKIDPSIFIFFSISLKVVELPSNLKWMKKPFL